MCKIAKKIGAIITAFVLLLGPGLDVLALSDEESLNFYRNGIYYYDPEGGRKCTQVGQISGNDVTWIGDSLSVGAKDVIESKLSGVDISKQKLDDKEYQLIQVSKQFKKSDGKKNYGGIPIAKALVKAGKMRKFLVFALGTNGTDSVTADTIKDLVDAVGENQKIIFVTNASDGVEGAPDFTSNNAAMKEAATTYSNITVADWAAVVGANSNKYIDDSEYHVHLSEEGNKVFVDTIYKALQTTIGSNGVNDMNSGMSTGNTLYNGNPIFTEAELQKIQELQPYYEKAASKYGFPWQMMAVAHRRESGLSLTNPSNNTYGVFQITPSNYASGKSLSMEEFQEQADAAAKIMAGKFKSESDRTSDNAVKYAFFGYNGRAKAYVQQARDLGFSEEEAENGEGSPYVMNMADEKRDPTKNKNWKQIIKDYGEPVNSPNNVQPGAFLMYAALGGSNGITVCAEQLLGEGNQDITKTALALAWDCYSEGHDDSKCAFTYSTAKPEYLEAQKSAGTQGDVTDCGRFVQTVLRYSGVDPSAVMVTTNMIAHFRSKSQLYENLGFISEDNLKSGDIIMTTGHAKLYVEVEGKGVTAQASLGSHAPQATSGVNIKSGSLIFRVKK